MKLFLLPDLGEGLPDAQIREWYVKVGDTVKTDQPIVSVETAKALVDVPAAFDGTVEKLFGKDGDTICTGEPLIGFAGDNETDQPAETRQDQGTVVGNITTGDEVLTDDTFSGAIVTERIASPAVRALARRRGIDLENVATHSERITMQTLKSISSKTADTPLEAGFEQLPGVRRAMILSMTQSHRDVVPVTITDDADIQAWYGTDNITIRTLRAVAAACKAEPMLNAYFDGKKMAYKYNEQVNIGLAVDTPHGLYVPVLKDIGNQSDEQLRTIINEYKVQAQEKTLPQAALQGATILVSNFGTIAGRYATPIILPPMTAIVAIGKLRDAVVAENGQPAVHKVIPLSLTVDHRAITGGEAARFLQALITSLQ